MCVYVPQIAAVVEDARSAAALPRRRRFAVASSWTSRAFGGCAAGREVEVGVQQDVQIMISPDFEVARDGPEMAPRLAPAVCSPGVGAPHLDREGRVPPPRRAAGAQAQLCRLTG